MTTKCILFDADGVVINSEMLSVQYQKEHDVSNDDMIPFFEGEFQNCIVGKTDLIELVKPWLPKWKWDGTVDEFLQFWFKAEHNVDERMVAVIRNLRKKGIKCYLATNQEKYRALSSTPFNVHKKRPNKRQFLSCV
jgi:putative hydrolase of the HAD superfamily